uniref:Uncharacterized protein n=1 Tax=Mola mola TaxID=94237 RepID=A0A3Q4AR40_MOLML
MHCWVLVALFFGICASDGQQEKQKVGPPSLSRGWGDNITWVKSYEEGLSKMKNGILSPELKKAFIAAKSIQTIAKENFILLNLVEETSDKNMAPDGYYVPRILFVDPSMTVRTDITGKYSNRHYTYEPGDMAQLLNNMKKAKVLLHNEL